MVKCAKRKYTLNKFDPKHDSRNLLWKNIKNEGLSYKDREISQISFSPSIMNRTFVELANFNLPTLSFQNANSSSQSILLDKPSMENFSFEFNEITEDEVIQSVMMVKSNSVGSDEISIKFLKLCLPTIAPILTHLFNDIVAKKCFPMAWKVSKVICLPKTREPTSPTDFRPITLLSSLSKAFEYIIDYQIKAYINSYNLYCHLANQVFVLCTAQLLF